MSPDTLAVIWFVLLGFLLIGYAVLDGFDLGVGMLHPIVAKSDVERRLFLNSIGPLWDGNEVWLVTFGGALFAAFPPVYATVFSGFYAALMLLLLALIVRAVSIEFRSKRPEPRWRRFWDWCFAAGSFAASLLFGVAVGNAMLGIPLDEAGDATLAFVDLLNPYGLLVGGLTAATFCLHGGIFLWLKLEGELRDRLRHWLWRGFGAFLLLYLFATIFTLILLPNATTNFARFPAAFVVVVVDVVAIVNIPRCLYWQKPGEAFISSAVGIAGLVALFGLALFPNLVTANNDPTLSLTAFNAASSPRTLGNMLIVAAVGMPLVLTYTVVVYRVFRGKVRLSEHSY
ncbi:MAG: cytochrome d ubiquinol oxidase subunit II [Deltaproteobacteria bacterium]|nr:cytochrome d ubiquinol oxidase subunit II [Deltaproteobacteria bacterium]